MATSGTKSGFWRILSLPWPVHFVIAIIAMVISAFLPEVMRQPSLLAFAKFVAKLAWFVAIVFGFFGVVGYGMKRYRRERPFGLVFGTPADESAGKSKRPQVWSLELLREVEWKRFELLCGAYYMKQGLRMETIARRHGGVDAKLYANASSSPVAMIHCRAWSGRVGVKAVRDLLTAMAQNGMAKGIFLASGTYSEDAAELAQQNRIELLNGSDLLQTIAKMSDAAQNELLGIATEGAYTTPTCPSCGKKMVTRNSETGFVWGCTKPNCKQTIELRPND